MARIRSSLSVKVFVSITAILLGVSLLIFVMLHEMMPRTYARQMDDQVMTNTMDLLEKLEVTPKAEWDHLLMVFSIENNVNVVLHELIEETNSDVFESRRHGSFYFSEANIAVQAEDESVLIVDENRAFFGFFGESLLTSVVLSFTFEYELVQYEIIVESNNFVWAASQMEGIFLQLAPYVFVVILGVALITAFFYARFLARPVVEIAQFSKKMVNLDLSWQLEMKRSDEIGVLASHLNQMYRQLTTTLSELKLANAKLQDDIEKEREHERRRRDFFTAVSHELKTPVTILKGELDGMILNIGKFKDRDKYLREAYQTSESIEKLVREIMTLVKLDTINLELEDTCLVGMIEDVIAIYEPMIGDKELEISLPSEVINVSADVVQLQTALSNIISNAIKHTPERNCIKISVVKANETAVLTVENEGVQLEEGEIVKLWEPFYRPDKSRSRDTGGSGLGLYIVKSILDLHDVEYELANSADGVRFVVRFSVE